MRKSPEPRRWNAIVLPSGENAGCVAIRRPFVICSGVPPVDGNAEELGGLGGGFGVGVRGEDDPARGRGGARAGLRRHERQRSSRCRENRPHDPVPHDGCNG